jgi:23S rRNA pseudouridine2605 synthase
MSRRKACDIVKSNGVKINGKISYEPWADLKETDYIEVDNKKFFISDLVEEFEKKYYLYHKPYGILTTMKDDFGRETIVDDIKGKIKENVFYIGRLDKNTSGLLLLTNDGDFANLMSKPSSNVKKSYYVMTEEDIKAEEVSKLENGVTIEGGIKTKPASLKTLKKKNEIIITITEGKKRQIRYMFKEVGHKVKVLKRISFGIWNLRDVPNPGDIKEIEPIKIKEFIKIIKRGDNKSESTNSMRGKRDKVKTTNFNKRKTFNTNRK